MYQVCPKCDHQPLPAAQDFPAACPACGVILAKVGQPLPRRAPALEVEDQTTWASRLVQVPDKVDAQRWWLRLALLIGLAVWGLRLVVMDHRNGEIGDSFLHGPLLVFHEAGHVIFAVFGYGLMMAGGSIFQLLLPLIICVAFLRQRHDPYGAAVGLWFLAVSMLDLAPYVYDAWQPQLMLLSGATGEEGGHDWIYLLSSMGCLHQAQVLGTSLRVLGAGVLILALGWAAALLWKQHGHIAPDVFNEGSDR